MWVGRIEAGREDEHDDEAEQATNVPSPVRVWKAIDERADQRVASTGRDFVTATLDLDLGSRLAR